LRKHEENYPAHDLELAAVIMLSRYGGTTSSVIDVRYTVIQEPQIHLHSDRSKLETMKMVGIVQGL
jgi:hypothetical protein